MSENDKENFRFFGVMLLFAATLCIGILLMTYAVKILNVWTSDLTGKSGLKDAVWESRVKVEKAKGIAEANKIIGDSLKGNEACLSYQWIDSLQHTKNKIIYVPTGSGLPILKVDQLNRECDDRRKVNGKWHGFRENTKKL